MFGTWFPSPVRVFRSTAARQKFLKCSPGLTSTEASLINRLRSIAERPSTSDCFKRSVSALKAKCGGELESDEGERVRREYLVSVSMMVVVV